MQAQWLAVIKRFGMEDVVADCSGIWDANAEPDNDVRPAGGTRGFRGWVAVSYRLSSDRPGSSSFVSASQTNL